MTELQCKDCGEIFRVPEGTSIPYICKRCKKEEFADGVFRRIIVRDMYKD